MSAWIPASWFFAAAIVLAAIGYTSGVLLYAMPTKGLHKFGQSLMFDGSTSVVLLTLSLGTLFFWNVIVNMFCQFTFSEEPQPGCLLPWSPFAFSIVYQNANAWVNGQINFAEGVGSLMQMLPVSLRAADEVKGWLPVPGMGAGLGAFIGNLLAPWVTLVNVFIVAMHSLLFWAEWIGPSGNFWAVLLFMGVFFYAIPGRIGRIVSGWLVGVSLGWMIGYPLLPTFVGSFVGSIFTATEQYLHSKYVPAVFAHLGPRANQGDVFMTVRGFADPVTSLVLNFVFIGLYLALIAGLVAGIARAVSGSTVPSAHGEPR